MKKYFVIACICIIAFALLYYLTKTKYEFFDYDGESISYEWGETCVVLLGRSYDTGIYGSPYRLSIYCDVHADAGIRGISVKNIKVSTNNSIDYIWQSETSYELTKLESPINNRKLKSVYTYRSPITSIDLPFEEIKVTALLLISSAEGVIEEPVEYIMVPHYRLEEGNHFLDVFLSA